MPATLSIFAEGGGKFHTIPNFTFPLFPHSGQISPGGRRSREVSR
jgi:hypothetical protein